MELIVGKTAGFCFGVKNAVDNTIKELNNNKNIYCLGELVHNKQVTDELEKKGVKFIDNISEAKGKVIIRAHGISKSIYEKAKNLNLDIIDLTCPKVLQIHKIAEDFCKRGYYIFLIGKASHPETIGTISFCGKNSYIIETEDDIQNAVNKYKSSKCVKAMSISQTTYSVEKFKAITQKLKEQIETLEIKNTICMATKLRQEETKEIAKDVNLMIIIGGKNSSNSNKLYDIAKKYCHKVLFIENANELERQKLKNIDRVGIMAGASTPKKSIDEVVDILQKKC